MTNDYAVQRRNTQSIDIKDVPYYEVLFYINEHNPNVCRVALVAFPIELLMSRNCWEIPKALVGYYPM